VGLQQPRFAVLGQIVEDVTGQPLDRYLRERIFGPLGMEHTDLIRSERVRPRLATGYVLRPGGLKPAADREVPTPGGAMYSTAADMGRYVAALLRGGAFQKRPGVRNPRRWAAGAAAAGVAAVAIRHCRASPARRLI